MKNLEIKWSYELKEGDRIIKAIKPRICKSFVVGFGRLMYAMLSSGTTVVKDTSNVDTTIYASPDINYFNVNDALGSTNYGVLVGTGTTAPAINDYKMETKILHGTTSGKIQYGSCTVGSPSSTSTQATFRTTRVFTNTSGGTITVEEIGLVLHYYVFIYVLIIRDVTGGIAVANGQSLTVNYDLTTTI